MSLADWSWKAPLVIGPTMPTMSTSWNACVPIAARATWPVRATSGTQSMKAVARPVSRFVAPWAAGGHAHANATSRAGVAVGRVGGVLLVAYEHVPQGGVAGKLAIEGQGGSARVAEQRRHARGEQGLTRQRTAAKCARGYLSTDCRSVFADYV